MSLRFPSMISYRGVKPCSTSTARSFFGRSLMWPSEALTMYCLPRYLLMVFALAGDSTITRAFGISNLNSVQVDHPEATILSRNSFPEAVSQDPASPARRARQSVRKPSYLLEPEEDRPSVWQYPPARWPALCDLFRVGSPVLKMTEQSLRMQSRSQGAGNARARLTDGAPPAEVPRLRRSNPAPAWRLVLSIG